MSFMVITLKKVPNSLRGDLTKWMQEIATGVYIGNLNRKVRENLWKRVLDNVKEGEATLSYTYNNEIGYNFDTINAERKIVDYDGIPLVLLPKEDSNKRDDNLLRPGFSNVAKFKKISRFQHKRDIKTRDLKSYVVIGLESDNYGIEEGKLEVFAQKIGDNAEEFHEIITFDEKHCNDAKMILERFLVFIEKLPLIGYNVKEDMGILNQVFERLNFPMMENKCYDLVTFVKKEKMFLSDYKLDTVLEAYGIRADFSNKISTKVSLVGELSTMVNKFLNILK